MYSYRSNLECLFRWMASTKMEEAPSASGRGTKRKMAEEVEEGSWHMSKVEKVEEVEKVEMKRKEDKSGVDKDKKDEVNFEQKWRPFG